MADIQNPGAPNRVSNFPESFFTFVFEGFEGLNTKPTRPAIEDQQCAWIDNFMPLGKNNARTLPDKGQALFTAASGTSVSHFNFGNIVETSYCIAFQGDGSIVAAPTTGAQPKTIAPAGTITAPTATIGLSQWGSQYILIAAPQTNGYFIWDGSLLYQAGTVGPTVTITNGGAGYTGTPTITPVNGTPNFATPAVFASTVTSAGAVSTITVTSAGANYVATDVVNLAFSGGGSTTGTTAIAYASVVGGRVTNVSIVNAGSAYTSGTLVSFQGGGGAGATATCTASGGVTAVTIATPGGGYTAAPTVIFTDTNNPVARAAVATMPFGVQGTTLETYANRVWIANGDAPTPPPPKNQEQFSAPGNPADFNTSDGAGSFLANDSFLRVGIHALKQSNGFLYEVGDSSVNYISGVQTSGNPPITTFSNQNIDPQVGSPWPSSVQVFGRAIVFANTFGVHALYGGAVQKVSLPLDGIYSTVTPTGTLPSYGGLTPSAAVATIFGIHVYILLLPIIDPITNTQRNALLMWDGKRWWTASQSTTLIKIASLEINSVLTAYGSDGHAIYPLFQTPSNAITKTIRSKLWGDPSYFMDKRAQLVYGLFQSNSNDAVGFTVAVDSEAQTQSVSVTNIFGVAWTATGGAAVTWTNNVGDPVTWQGGGLARFQQRIPDVSGALLGLTLQTTGLDYSLISLLLTGQQYRAPM